MRPTCWALGQSQSHLTTLPYLATLLLLIFLNSPLTPGPLLVPHPGMPAPAPTSSPQMGARSPRSLPDLQTGQPLLPELLGTAAGLPLLCVMMSSVFTSPTRLTSKKKTFLLRRLVFT